MSRLEDPEFTIKDALVITPYPGASALEVAEEVSDEIELAAQQLGQLKEVESKSDRGLSTVTVRIKDQYDKADAAPGLGRAEAQGRRRAGRPAAGGGALDRQRRLRRRVGACSSRIYGDEYTDDRAQGIRRSCFRRELLLVKDVAKIEFWGDRRREAVYVVPDRDRMSQLGIYARAQITQLAASDKNIVVNDSGRVRGRARTSSPSIRPGSAERRSADFGDLLDHRPPDGASRCVPAATSRRIRARPYVDPAHAGAALRRRDARSASGCRR